MMNGCLNTRYKLYWAGNKSVQCLKVQAPVDEPALQSAPSSTWPLRMSTLHRKISRSHQTKHVHGEQGFAIFGGIDPPCTFKNPIAFPTDMPIFSVYSVG
ncbi:hypothetical protein SKAU_G00107800 [Synaphobranchus kaupii]|uniref:Uncharacterized protein n=1 Tax=Synaphobranchus kaupii TaxID=118154 RepID=A0A9Q1G037_SYNKA|nr:hypothetical protein SKAU_G00107800 [Synaphobranchus kaupii]